MKKILFRVYDHIEEYVFIFFFFIMAISMFLQVFSRIIMHSLYWTEEITRWAFIWIVFIGFSYVEKNDSAIRINVFVDVLPRKVKLVCELFTQLLITALLLYMLYWSIQYYIYGTKQISYVLEISKVYVIVCLPIGFTMAIVNAFKNIKKKIQTFNVSFVTAEKIE